MYAIAACQYMHVTDMRKGDRMKESSAFRRYGELALGIAMMALSAFYLYFTTTIRVRGNHPINSRTVPYILGGMVLVLAVAQIVSGIKHIIAANDEARQLNLKIVGLSIKERQSVLPIILTFVFIIGYAIAFDPIGFVISSIGCMFCMMMLLTPKSVKKPIMFFIISVVVALVVYIAFRRGLNLSLPRGLLYNVPL